MNRLRIKKIKEKKLIGMKVRRYIDFVILACCLVIAFNIHPSKIASDNVSLEKHSMIYIFHDYEGNEYIMNDKIHGASNSWDYLFNDEIPNDLKGDDEKTIGSVSLGDLLSDKDIDSSTKEEGIDSSVKDNQISLDDIINELGLNSENIDNTGKDYKSNSGSDILVINIGDPGEPSNQKSNYTVKEINTSDDNSYLIIEKAEDNTGDIDNNLFEDNNKSIENNNIQNDNLLDAEAFTFIEDGRVLPTLISRNDLLFDNNNQPVAYINNSDSNGDVNNQTKESGITIIADYEDCMTPWGYKIHHGDSVLAYKQMEDSLDICNIERRFCWKGKLSGTYTQQGCSINENYTYEQWGDVKVVTKESGKTNLKGNIRQNSDGSVTVKNNENGASFVFDRPNNTYTDFRDNSNNIRFENSGVEQTTRTYADCVSPRGERVKHGQFIQAFKHENGFSDAPCEAQIRLCTMGELMGTYTESTCKTWNTSFIDWVNGSPTRKTYSKEKLDLVRKQIKDEENYYNNARDNAEKSTDSDVLDRILYILDQD